MTWTVRVAKSARKQLATLPVKDHERIVAALGGMADDPFSGDIVKLEGEGSRWRRRVGNYRIIFSVGIATRTVDVSAISRRTSSTY